MDQKATFGETLKKLREAQGFPLRQVAEALKIDTSMLAKIEKNERNPSNSFIENCAQFFAVDADELKVAFLSDKVAYQIMSEENAIRILKVAEQKIKYSQAGKKRTS